MARPPATARTARPPSARLLAVALTSALFVGPWAAAPAYAQQADTDCGDYSSQEEAQAAYDSDREQFADLDRDDDGVACENFDYSGANGGGGTGGGGSTTETPGASGALTFSQVLQLQVEEELELALFQAKGRSTASRTGSGSTTIDPQEALAFAGVVGGMPGEQTPAELQEFNGALATLDDPGPVEKEPMGFPDNPILTLNGGAASAEVRPATGDSLSDQDGLNLVTKPIAEIEELAQLTGPLSEALEELEAALSEASDGAIGGLGEGLDPVISELPPELRTVVEEILGDDLENVQTLADELTQLLQLLDSPLLSITDLTQDQTITQEEGGVRGTATTTVGEIVVLGSLLRVAGPKTSATAFSTGRPGTASAEAVTDTAAAVELLNGNLAELILGDGENQVDLSVLDGGLSPVLEPVAEAAEQVLAELTAGLEQGGLRVGVGTERTNVADDGQQATAQATGLVISFTPPAPPGGEEPSAQAEPVPLFELSLGESQVATAMRLATTQTEEEPPTLGGGLPRTGLDADLLGGVAVASLLAAGWLRRRRTA